MTSRHAHHELFVQVITETWTNACVVRRDTGEHPSRKRGITVAVHVSAL
jgi:hypothetical protein